MESCRLNLGDEAWERLAEERLWGSMVWNDGPALEVAVKVRGAHSRRFPKKSLQVDLVAERLPDEPPVDHTVRRVHLNADYIDPTLMRSTLSFWLFQQAGVPAPNARHALVTVSGEPAGIYVALESVDSDFCRRRGWLGGPIYYAINRNANFGLVSPFSQSMKEPLEQGYRTMGRWETAPLRQMLTELNLASTEQFRTAVRRWLDVAEYLRWLMVAVFVGNRDGFVHNYALYQDPTTERFQIIPWDYDATWGIDIHGRRARLDRVPITGWNKLSHRLLNDSQWRKVYRTLLAEALDGVFAPEAIHPQIDKLAAHLAPWIDKYPPDSLSGKPFEAHVDRLRKWATRRRDLLLSQLEEL